MRHRTKLFLLGAIGLLFLVVAGGPYWCMAIDIGIAVLTTRAGVGDVEKARARIEGGMTRDEVRSLLGRPHREDDVAWDYWETIFVGSVLRIHFGADGRVKYCESWCQ
jgi:SmpA / OmlA family